MSESNKVAPAENKVAENQEKKNETIKEVKIKCKGNCVSELKNSLEGIKEAVMLLVEKQQQENSTEETSSNNTEEIPIQQHFRGGQQFRGAQQFRGGRGFRGGRRIRFFEPYGYDNNNHDRYRRAGSLGPRRY
ncbi:unnamed protein product [Meloidogyne enterolobii]|uniref:Uncharacterized protein n=1 Tax=Meloidogyne enterolobii TaxID=390850 RepID=A0ACB0YU15_MELEN